MIINVKMQNSLNDGKPLFAETSSFANFWEKYLDSVLQETTVDEEDLDEYWFLVSDVGFTGYCAQDVVPTETEESRFYILLFLAIMVKPCTL